MLILRHVATDIFIDKVVRELHICIVEYIKRILKRGVDIKESVGNESLRSPVVCYAMYGSRFACVREMRVSKTESIPASILISHLLS